MRFGSTLNGVATGKQGDMNKELQTRFPYSNLKKGVPFAHLQLLPYFLLCSRSDYSSLYNNYIIDYIEFVTDKNNM
jgi:hypothetical protein